MNSHQKKIAAVQAKIYRHLVEKGKVSAQIAESQPLSESMAAILPDAVRVSKSDEAVAEAAAISLSKFYLTSAAQEEGIRIRCAGNLDGWIVYGDILCVTNPYDSQMMNKASGWARSERVVISSVGVVSSSYLSQLRAVHGGDNANLEENVDNDRALQQVEDIIRHAAQLDASDIHFVPNQSEQVALLYRIDGILRAQRKIDLKLHDTMVRTVMEQRCEVTLQSTVPQDGEFELALDNNKSINLRVSTMPVCRRSGTSLKMVMRLLGNNTALVDLKHLNMSEQHYEQLVRFGNYPNGLIVLTGPTGSGKTTTLSAELLNMQSTNPNRNFHTIEDPVEMQHQGMSHTEVSSTLSFASALRSLLRQDPDVILVGEMRDEETAELGYKAATTGHLVLTTLHTNNSHESIGRLERMGIDTEIIVTNTTAFIAQRLVRRLCQHCKTQYRLKDDPVRLAKYGQNRFLKEKGGDAVLFRANRLGCEKCGGISAAGEKGRHSIIEILEMTPDVQVELLNGMTPSILRRKQIQEGTFLDLWDDGLRLVAAGIVGFEQLETTLKPYEVDRAEVYAPLGKGRITHVSVQDRVQKSRNFETDLSSL